MQSSISVAKPFYLLIQIENCYVSPREIHPTIKPNMNNLFEITAHLLFLKKPFTMASPIRHQRQTMQNLAIIAIADNKRSPS